MIKQIIICADDFAQNQEISDGILLLAREKRINAISCMVNGSYWVEASNELTSLAFNGYIGLHLNLTFGQPLSSIWRKCEGEEFYPLPVLLRKLYLGKIPQATLEAEIQAQIDVFAHSIHMYPDFIDGHQHIQQFRGVREALFAVHDKVLEQADKDVDYTDAFFRNTSNGSRDFLSLYGFPKVHVLNLLGGRKFKNLLTVKQIPTNLSFAGVYNFKNAYNYRKYFQTFLNKSVNGGIIMCHPGTSSKDLTDSLYKYRHHELNYLMSDVFLTDMEDKHYNLVFKKL